MLKWIETGDGAVWLKIMLFAALVVSTSVSAAPQTYEVKARTYVKDNGSSSVLLLDMVHFGPVRYYSDLSQQLDRYAKSRQNIAVLLEGVQCRNRILGLRDHIQRWPFPTLEELNARFSAAELAAARAGRITPQFYQYFRTSFAKNIGLNGMDYYFTTQPCEGQKLAQGEHGHRATQLQGIDNLYAQTASRMLGLTGLPTMTQSDRGNPLWARMFNLADQGTIRAIVMSDIDQSQVDPRDLDQLLWQARMSVQDTNPALVHTAYEYLNVMWYSINQRGFRNQIVINSLAMGIQRGHRHFVLPWGEAHNEDLERRLLEMGYRPAERVIVPYAPCSYVKAVVANDSCKMGL